MDDDLTPYRREVLILEAEKLKAEIRNFELKNQILENILKSDCQANRSNVMFSQVFDSQQQGFDLISNFTN